MKFIFTFLVLFQAAAFAIIIETNDLMNIKEAVSLETLVVFDMDETITMHTDAILHPNAALLYKKLKEEILTPEVIQKYPDNYLLSKTLLSTKPILVDPSSPSFIQELQQKGIKTIMLTASRPGKLGLIPDMSARRLAILSEFGIDFSASFPLEPISFSEFSENQKTQIPMFRGGLLLTGHHPKGKVLAAFLKHIEFFPPKIIFIDDKREEVESVENEMEKLGIEVIGYHYLGAKNKTVNIDEELAEFQFRSLAESGEWYSDSEAQRKLKNAKPQ